MPVNRNMDKNCNNINSNNNNNENHKNIPEEAVVAHGGGGARKECDNVGSGGGTRTTMDNYNRQLDMENNNSIMSPSLSSSATAAPECRLFINPYVFSDYAIGRYIDDTSQTRTLSSATSTAAIGQESWTMSVSPFSHSDLVRSSSGVAGDYVSGQCDNNYAGVGAFDGAARGRSWQYPSASKFKFLRSKFMRNRRNKLNRLSNKIAENTESSAYIRAENCFQDKFRMQPSQAAAVASSVLMPPKVKPKVSKIAKGPARGGLGGGGGGGGRGGDKNESMMRRPRRRMSDKKQLKEQEMLAQLLSLESYEQTWYL